MYFGQNRKRAKMDSDDEEQGIPIVLNSALTASADWDDYLMDRRHAPTIAAVTLFTHAPLVEQYDKIVKNQLGVHVEVPNPFVSTTLTCNTNGHNRPVYWVGNIIHFSGYKALVELINFRVSKIHLAWISYFSDIPKPIGYCIENKIPLYPPCKRIVKQHPDFIKKVYAELYEPTIPSNHADCIRVILKEIQNKIPIGSSVEVLDKEFKSRNKNGIVDAVIGDRIHIKYKTPMKATCPGVWYSIHSELVHPIGWSEAVGHEIYDPLEPGDLGAIKTPQLLFPQNLPNLKLSVGQLLEVRDPWIPFQFCEVVVSKILKHGYFMVQFRTSEKETKKELKFCFHILSPYIFPVGFCKRNEICVRKDWVVQKQQDASANYAPLEFLPKRPQHQFKEGMKLEVCDILEQCYIGPGSILRVVGHLLLVRYDGWDADRPQSSLYISADSPDIYPVGYCEMVGFPMQGYPVSALDNKVEEDKEKESSDSDSDFW